MPDTSTYINLDSVRSTWREGLLILLYHAIETPPLPYRNRGLYVEPGKLRSQLKELQKTGARFVSLTDWNRNRSNERQVAVTFDDGFQNVFLQGLPVLQELAIPAINYIVVDGIGRTNDWDRAIGAQMRPLMQRPEISAWLQAGHEIGSHSLTHPRLTLIPPAVARREIVESKRKLEDFFNQPVRHFCYPYGDWNERIRDMVCEAGYETACTTHPGTNRKPDDLMGLHRYLATHQRPIAVALGRTLQKWCGVNQASMCTQVYGLSA